jgi:hypothetical protein
VVFLVLTVTPFPEAAGWIPIAFFRKCYSNGGRGYRGGARVLVAVFVGEIKRVTRKPCMASVSSLDEI